MAFHSVNRHLAYVFSLLSNIRENLFPTQLKLDLASNQSLRVHGNLTMQFDKKNGSILDLSTNTFACKKHHVV